jgi:hypothetical protein
MDPSMGAQGHPQATQDNLSAAKPRAKIAQLQLNKRILQLRQCDRGPCPRLTEGLLQDLVEGLEIYRCCP